MREHDSSPIWAILNDTLCNWVGFHVLLFLKRAIWQEFKCECNYLWNTYPPYPCSAVSFTAMSFTLEWALKWRETFSSEPLLPFFPISTHFLFVLPMYHHLPYIQQVYYRQIYKTVNLNFIIHWYAYIIPHAHHSHTHYSLQKHSAVTHLKYP